MGSKLDKFKKMVNSITSTFSSSKKEDELNKILDKIGTGGKMTSSEKDFIDNYHTISDLDIQDLLYLDREKTAEKILQLLSSRKTIICDLFDKNGKIGSKIEDIEIDLHTERKFLILYHNEEVELKDSFLYNIIYTDRNEYSLQSQDEYFEKILISENI